MDNDISSGVLFCDTPFKKNSFSGATVIVITFFSGKRFWVLSLISVYHTPE